MRNLKKLLAVIVAVCVLATMAIPAFAAETTASDAEVCESLAILRGDGAGVTDTYLAKGTERFQAALLYLRLIGNEEEALAFTGEDNFADADLIYAGGQKVLAYLKANPDLGWTGVGAGKFEPTNPATAQMIYKVLLEALGYKQDVDFTWAEAITFAETKGLSAIADVTELTNNDMAIAIVEALKATVKDGEVTLAQKLVDDGIIGEAAAAELGLIELEPEKLEVVGVTADNLKEVVVVFNKAVDGDTVNKDNVKVDGKDGSVSLNDDKVTAVITIDGDGLDNQSDNKLVVSGVKDADGTEIEKTELTFKAFDATLPVAEKVTVTGPRNFTITFSEPIKNGGEVEVKSGTSVIGVSSSFGVGGRDVTVDLYSSLADGKTYDITVKGFEDYAEYKNVIKTFSLAYAKDNSAPTATVEKVDQKYVKVKFNKPVTGLYADQFYHTFTAWKALDIYKAEDFKDENKISKTDSVDTVWAKFANSAEDGKPIGEGSTIFGIKGKTENGEIKDNWDNKFETVEFNITVSADKVAPEIEELTVDTEDSLKIIFTEGVKFGDDNVEIFDTDGKAIDGVSASVAHVKDNKEWKINLGKNLAGKSIVVTIKDVEDLALQPNRMSTYTSTLTVTDKTAPKINKVTINAAQKALYVFFDEAVDSTAVDKANYALIDETDLTLTLISNSPAFYDGDKVVKIELTDDEYVDIATMGLFVQKVKDLAGNAMAGTTYKNGNIKAYNDPTNAPKVEKVEVVAADKVEITFDQYLRRVDRDAFKVNGTTAAAMELSESDGKTVVTLIVTADGSKFASDKAGAEIVVAPTDTYKVLNIFDVQATTETIDAAGMTDKIAPSITKTDDKYDITASGDTITIEFDEAIDDGALSTKTFEVKDYTVTDISSNNTKEVTIKLSKEISAKTEISITQKLAVYDMAGNEYKLGETVKVTIP